MTDSFITYSDESDKTISKKFTLSNALEQADNNSKRLRGEIRTGDPSFPIHNVQYSVNGGGWNNATATDGSFNSPTEKFYFDFLPTANDYSADGFTISLRAITSGGRIADNLFYFSPFTLNAPEHNLFTSDELPTFSFSINKGRFDDLKNNLSKFTVMINKHSQGWQTYIDDIPVSYENIKRSGENTQPAASNEKGNGTYENKKLWAQYSDDNATINVRAQAVDDSGNGSDTYFENGGKKLSPGSYQWKIVSVDKQGHTQETETRFLRVNSRQTVVRNSFFPLAVLNISGLGNPGMSTTHLTSMREKYSISSLSPIFYGISNVNSKVTLELTDTTCEERGESGCVQSFETFANPESRFGINVPPRVLRAGRNYTSRLFVESENDYNELPEFELKVR